MEKNQFMVGVSWDSWAESWLVAFITADEWDMWETIILSEDGVNATGANLPEDGWEAFFDFMCHSQSKLTARGLASSQDIRLLLANIVLRTTARRLRLVSRDGKRV